MSREDQIKNLMMNHNRRLQKLREQAALCGLSVDPRIPIEIENIEAEIKKLQAELEELEDGVKLPNSKQRVQIYLQGDFSSLTAERRSSIVDALAGLLRILPEAIEVYRVYEGEEWITEGEFNLVTYLHLTTSSDTTKNLRETQNERRPFLPSGTE